MHRQTGVDTPAFPPARPAPTDGRYHRSGDPWPLYASLEPSTAWAEWDAATGGAVDPAAERRRLWSVDVSELPVLDLRRQEARDALGVTQAELSGPRWAAQAAAVRARSLGALGVVAPSAARPNAWNLVVFPDGFARLRTRGSRVTHPRPPAVSLGRGGAESRRDSRGSSGR